MQQSDDRRRWMVEHHLRSRGIRDPRVLEAMQSVPREDFVRADMSDLAYEDSALPIEEEQTISQPYIVAHMVEALELEPGDRVLEVGTGSGYAAAVLGEVAGEVYTVERYGTLADTAANRLASLGYDNVHVLHADGTLGWPEHAPYDAIVVAAGGPDVPRALQQQLAVGGRLVIPTGPTPRLQELVRVRRTGENDFERENLGGVRFVPLVGREGWEDDASRPTHAPPPPAGPRRDAPLPQLIAGKAEAFPDIESADLDGLLDRIGDARVVCLGEASHGTSEFYEMRARITRELIERKGFDTVAVEADWPDAASIDRLVRDTPSEAPPERPFSRFPTWMWLNEEVLAFVRWLREHNRRFDEPGNRVGFFGLDMYSMFSSIAAVLGYLEDIDPDTARLARERYGCLSPWEGDPATYGRTVISQRFRECEAEVAAMLRDLFGKQAEYAHADGDRYLDAVQNARLVANAERYYRIMYYGGDESWNLRDSHMTDTLGALLDHRGTESRAVVWAHNSHLGDASATEMGARGQHNVGQLVRERYGDASYLVGFGTDRGTVAAADDWEEPMQVMEVRPSHEGSYEHLCHRSGVERFLLPLTGGAPEVRRRLADERLERAIGVIYRPRTELASHYFRASLSRQFDEYIWFDRTRAVTPLTLEEGAGVPETYPFGV